MGANSLSESADVDVSKASVGDHAHEASVGTATGTMAAFFARAGDRGTACERRPPMDDVTLDRRYGIRAVCGATVESCA